MQWAAEHDHAESVMCDSAWLLNLSGSPAITSNSGQATENKKPPALLRQRLSTCPSNHRHCRTLTVKEAIELEMEIEQKVSRQGLEP